MGRYSKEYIAQSEQAERKPWKAEHPYVEGVRVYWRCVRLVCTRGHFAGPFAEHPWDPGDGWPAVTAAQLWSPDGKEQTQKLRVAGDLDDDERLLQVLAYASGKLR